MSSEVDGLRAQAAYLTESVALAMRFGPLVLPVLHHEGKRKRKPTGMWDVGMALNGALTFPSLRDAQEAHVRISIDYHAVLTERRRPLIASLKTTLNVAASADEFDEIAAAMKAASFMAPIFAEQQGHYGGYRLVQIQDNAVRFAGPDARKHADELALAIDSIIRPWRCASVKDTRERLDALFPRAFDEA